LPLEVTVGGTAPPVRWYIRIGLLAVGPSNTDSQSSCGCALKARYDSEMVLPAGAEMIQEHDSVVALGVAGVVTSSAPDSVTGVTDVPLPHRNCAGAGVLDALTDAVAVPDAVLVPEAVWLLEDEDEAEPEDDSVLEAVVDPLTDTVLVPE